MGTIRLPVSRMPGQRGADTRFKAVHFIGTASIRRCRIDLAINRRHDRKVVVRHQIGEVSIPPAQRHDDRIRTVGPYLDDRIDDGLGGRSAFGAAMIVDRRNHIFGGNRATAMERNSRADPESPGRSVGAGLPAFRHFADKRPICRNFRKVIVA